MFTRLIQRNIALEDVKCALSGGEIIEQYPQDYPYPSCLVLGMVINKRCLHIVCGLGNNELWLVTAYYPDVNEWSDDFKVRKGNVE